MNEDHLLSLTSFDMCLDTLFKIKNSSFYVKKS